MGRWRPPGKPAAPYITAEGFRLLEQESKRLWEHRREVVRHLAAAAAEGDRSENAEYQYRKKELREIDRRLGYLQRRMPVLEVVSRTPDSADRVFFGALVELEDERGQLHRFRVVGSDEARPEAGAISLDAPLAQRLMGRRIDDEIEFEPMGRLIVTAIEYPT